MPEPIRQMLEEDERLRVERARRVLKNSRKDSADKWVDLMPPHVTSNGVKQELWYNVETGEVRGRRTDTHLGAILDANKDEYVATMNNTGKVPEMRKVATIPMGIFMDNFQTAMVENDFDHVKKMLNDPDNKALRTWRGRV